MISRNTRQKEIILDILKHNQTHPTIQEIYAYSKKIHPKIGQATVYRNINKLVEEGKIIKLSTNNNSYHYDININQHDHLLCKKCGRISDLYDNDYKDIINKIEKNDNIKVEKITVLLEGICQYCYK